MLAGCLPCLVRLAITTARMGKADERAKLESARKAMEVLTQADYSYPAPFYSAKILSEAHKIIGADDPFLFAKRVSNQIGLKLAKEFAYPYLAEVSEQKERIFRAVKVAIAGNVVDYAVEPDLGDKIGEKIQEAFGLEFSWLDFENFCQKLKKAQEILYLCDNAGEIAFDRILIEELVNLGKKVKVAVKAGPALNDALLGDALEVGLDKVKGAELITTGQAMMGLDLERAGKELKSAWNEAELILAKGQANFECLAGRNGKPFFLTLIKCQALEEELGLKKGSAIFVSGEFVNGKTSLTYAR